MVIRKREAVRALRFSVTNARDAVSELWWVEAAARSRVRPTLSLVF